MAEVKEIQLKIPNLGEAESTEIIELNVKKGDVVAKNDPLIVLESEKAAMEIPSDYDGEIKEIFVSEGQSVTEGMPYAVITSTSGPIEKQKPDFRNNDSAVKNEASQHKREAPVNFSGLNAGPAVRKYARELEIDLKKIIGTGKNLRITKDDLKKFIHQGKSTNTYKVAKESDFEGQGKYVIQKQSKIQALGAKNLHESWVSIPHVTHFEEANLTKFKSNNKEISLLAGMVFIVAKVLKEMPIFNSSLLDQDRIIIKDYINIGIAVSTEVGLVVPVIKNANEKSVLEISEEVSSLAKKAREKKLQKDEISGSTFTISSLGKIGGVGFTPIINPPEVAIISLSRSKKELFLSKSTIQERELLPFAMSYDHRVINGSDAGQFMLRIKKLFEDERVS
ncbi:MAG: 2-oxo acid dehydrogenase subunit E2 [SAR86 cluster bacterium]|nr:2-oxo acid dehydrogenase subunit E2 [SAR86 cluster bacterium]